MSAEGPTQLDPADIARVRPLFEPLSFRLDVAAILEGTKPGLVWVDDPDSPRAALLTGGEGSALVGEPSDAFVRALRRLVTERIYVEDPLGLGRRSIRVAPWPDAWVPLLPEILGRPPIHCVRRAYLQELAGEPCRFPLPGGYEIRDLDGDLIEDPEVEVAKMALSPMSYGVTLDEFLAHRFACVAVHDGRTVSWCHVNSVVGRAFEVGVFTEKAHLRKGVGSATVAATLQRARQRGLSTAGWQCDVRNVPSVRMAEHLGFSLHREYDMFLAVGDEKLHTEVTERWREGRYV